MDSERNSNYKTWTPCIVKLKDKMPYWNLGVPSGKINDWPSMYDRSPAMLDAPEVLRTASTRNCNCD